MKCESLRNGLILKFSAFRMGGSVTNTVGNRAPFSYLKINIVEW